MRGIYSLVIKAKQPVKIYVGSLGKIRFYKGYYIYVGSALNNLEARIARHMKRGKKLKWHIDYLLASPKIEIEWIVTKPTRRRLECLVNKKIQRFATAVKGFGSSDCKCGSHLSYFKSFDKGMEILRRAFRL